MELTAQINSNEDAIRWAQRHRLIAGSQTCSRCPGNVAMVLEDCREDVGDVQHRAAVALARFETGAFTPILSYL